MSAVLIKDPSCDKEIMYLKLTSEANYCGRLGQGQSVPEQAAGKCFQSCSSATRPVSPLGVPVPSGHRIPCSVARRLWDQDVGLRCLIGAKNEFLWLVLFLPGSNFCKIHSKTIKAWLFWGCGILDPPINSTTSFPTTPTWILASRVGDLFLSFALKWLVPLVRLVCPVLCLELTCWENCCWPHLTRCRPLLGILSCACTTCQSHYNELCGTSKFFPVGGILLKSDPTEGNSGTGWELNIGIKLNNIKCLG